MKVKIMFVFSLNIIFYLNVCGQKDILNSKLNDYGTKLKFVSVWTDDEFIVVLTKGLIEKTQGHIFFLIHPEKGIVSHYNIKKSEISTYDLLSSNKDSITVFFRMQEGFKSINQAWSVSKISGQSKLSQINGEIKRTNRESYFSFIKDGRLIFASITKDKEKLGFRELMSNGEDKITHLFDIPDTLLRYIKYINRPNNINTKVSSMTLIKSANLEGSNVRLIGIQQANKRLGIDVFDFDLVSSRINIRSTTQYNKYNSVFATFSGDILFLIKAGSTLVGYDRISEMHLDVIQYPTFKSIKTFICNQNSPSIPFKTTHLNQVSYKSGLYFSGQNKKYSDLEVDGIDVKNTLETISRGSIFMRTKSDNKGGYLFKVGSQSDAVMTNTLISKETYFFGCLDSNFNPCGSTETEKTPDERRSEFLTSIQKEKPDFLDFGYNRSFLIVNLKGEAGILIKEF